MLLCCYREKTQLSIWVCFTNLYHLYDPAITVLHDIISNLKFVQDFKRTGELWVQFMDFVWIIRMFVRAKKSNGANVAVLCFSWQQQVRQSGVKVPCKQVVLNWTEVQRRFIYNLAEDKLFCSGIFTDQVIDTLGRKLKRVSSISLIKKKSVRSGYSQPI